MYECSVSVIIPAYNVEEYLEEALDSIKNQEEFPDEVILIDDGSIDRTREVAESYHFSVPYQVVSITNSGQGNARNLGVNLASSDYVYFFDSDDLLREDFIGKLKKHISRNKFPDIILFSGESFYDSKYQGSRGIDYRRRFSGFFKDRSVFLNNAFSNNSLFCSPCLYVSKKKLWGPTNLKFGPNYLEDEAIFFNLLFACQTFLVIDEVYFLRRKREGSTTTIVPNSKHVNGALCCIRANLNLYSNKNFSSEERLYVGKRLHSNCTAYIWLSRRAGFKLEKNVLCNVIWKIQSLELVAKVFFYILRLDNFDFPRRCWQKLKKL